MSFKIATDPVKELYNSRTVYKDFQYLVWQQDLGNEISRSIIIEKYLGHNSTVRIPAKIKDIPVLEIGENAFRNQKTIETVIFPISVRVISNRAFFNCSGLKKINLGIDIVFIGKDAFKGCIGLDDKARKAIKDKQKNYFDYKVERNKNNISLTLVRYRKNMQSIWDHKNYIFYIHKQFKKSGKPINNEPEIIDNILAIPDKIDNYPVTSLDMNSLPEEFSEIVIPSSIISINPGSFGNSEKLEKIIVHDDNPVYSSTEGVLYDKPCETLIYCPGGKSGVLNIPDKMKSYGEFAFSSSSKITKFIASKKNNHFSTVNGLLLNKKGNTLLLCPPSREGKIIIPGTVNAIESKVFFYCKNITSVILPKNLNKIDEYAFRETNIQSITIPGSLKYMGVGAFSFCSNLKRLTIEDGVTEISVHSFYECDKLKTVKLPKSLIKINCQAFKGDTSLSPSTIKKIAPIILDQEKREGSDEFEYSLYETYGDDWFGPIKVHSDIIYISGYKGNKEIVTIPKIIRGVKSIVIGQDSFVNCTFVKKLNVPDNVIKMEPGSLRDCKNLNKKNRENLINRYGTEIFH